MKAKILALAVIVIMAGSTLISCGQSSKQDAKAVKEDAKALGKDLKKGAVDTNKEIKMTVNSNWKKFENASQSAIEATDTQIKALRTKIETVSKAEKEKLTTALDQLEQKNEALKDKLAKKRNEFKEGVISFNETTIANEQKFEREFTHDMDELGSALKDLFKNNVD
ncbi:hypothetical protein [Psychroserpens sp. NJDZ02]|uniref:hypothetical protein n=1 Tax=Psychroserpens sp. NJDZ02 TaxID=2570561 RepID=UPI0010A902F0|nr:hypothetical protein [Psychroserpens sp. NJDZ02]QCE40483.1 hypothetical protein E9099_03320 [Psychroserpens sp. NJDZ02]